MTREEREPDWHARFNLARALLQRPEDEMTADLIVMALRGASVAELFAYERAAA